MRFSPGPGNLRRTFSCPSVKLITVCGAIKPLAARAICLKVLPTACLTRAAFASRERAHFSGRVRDSFRTRRFVLSGSCAQKPLSKKRNDRDLRTLTEAPRPNGTRFQSERTKRLNAYNQPAHPQAPAAPAEAEQGARPERLPATSRRVHPGLYDDPEEAELRAA